MCWFIDEPLGLRYRFSKIEVLRLFVSLFIWMSELNASSRYSFQAWFNAVLFSAVLSSRKWQTRVLFLWAVYYLVALSSLLIVYIAFDDGASMEEAVTFIPAATLSRMWSLGRRWVAWTDSVEATSVGECYATMLVVVAVMLRDCQFRTRRKPAFV